MVFGLVFAAVFHFVGGRVDVDPVELGGILWQRWRLARAQRVRISGRDGGKGGGGEGWGDGTSEIVDTSPEPRMGHLSPGKDMK